MSIWNITNVISHVQSRNEHTNHTQTRNHTRFRSCLGEISHTLSCPLEITHGLGHVQTITHTFHQSCSKEKSARHSCPDEKSHTSSVQARREITYVVSHGQMKNYTSYQFRGLTHVLVSRGEIAHNTMSRRFSIFNAQYTRNHTLSCPGKECIIMSRRGMH